MCPKNCSNCAHNFMNECRETATDKRFIIPNPFETPCFMAGLDLFEEFTGVCQGWEGECKNPGVWQKMPDGQWHFLCPVCGANAILEIGEHQLAAANVLASIALNDLNRATVWMSEVAAVMRGQYCVIADHRSKEMKK